MLSQHLGDVANAYAAAIDPITEGLHWDIMQRLSGQLGMTAPTTAMGDGDATANSDDATD